MSDKKRSKPAARSGDVTLTILHVSDMQFGRNHRFGRLGLGGADEPFDTLLKRLTDDLDQLRRDQGLKPDLVALTGDLAEWGKPKEFADVLSFCTGLQTNLELSRDRILVVPGNHDINRSFCLSYFAACEGNDEKPVEPYWPKWAPYVDFFGKLYKDVARYKFKQTEPYTWFELPEFKVAVAGLNSTMRESHKEKDPQDPARLFGHYGYLGEAQLAWFGKKLEEAKRKGWLRIGLVHHNALRGAADDDENLRDAHMLQDRLGAKLNLLLHGHTHDGKLGWLGRNLPVISTGSAAVGAQQRPDEVPNQYQIIQVRRDGFTTWARQYVPAARKWIGDPRVSESGGDWHHEQSLDLPDTHGTFGALESGAGGRQRAPKTGADDEDGPDERRRPEREPNDLLSEVMDACRVRDEPGRVQATRVRGEGPWGDYCRVTDPARGTYLLGAHPGPLTPDVLACWVEDVHEPFRSRGNQGRTSDLVIGSQAPFSDLVSARAGTCGVQIHRRIDYENLIDTERWKESQLARLDSDAEYRRDLYIEQRVTLWSPVDDTRSVVHPAADRIVDALCGDGGSFVVVLGAAGTGKTFLLREVARRMTARQSVVTPIIVELRGLDRASDVFELVSAEFVRRRLTLPYRAFERDLREGRIALLFDGFDELATRVRSAAIPEHFSRIVSAARERARILVSSRAEHFTSHTSALDVLMSRATSPAGLAGQLQTIAQRRLVVTQPFTPEDIEAYLGKALGSADAGRQRMQRFRKVHDLPGLAATPRLLSFLVRLTDAQLDAAAARHDELTPTALYRLVIVDHWLAQQEQRLNPPGGPPGPTRDALLDSAKRLALHLWRSTAKAAALADLDAGIGEQLRRLCEEDTDVARQMLQGRTLLVHGEDGRLTFIHQTVLEWLVGQALAEQLTAGGADVDLGSGRLSDFLIGVLRDLVGDERLAGWAYEALGGTPGNRLAENARLVLSRIGVLARKTADLRGQDLRGQSLEGQDLRGARLDAADLRGVDLSGRDLSGASLRSAKLAHADLRGATLTGANLEGADLSFARLDRAAVGGVRWSNALLLATRALGTTGRAEQVKARFSESAAWAADSLSLWPVPSGASCLSVAFSPDGRLLATGHSDGLLRLWDVQGTTLLCVMDGHTNLVRSVAWSPDGTCLASGSDDNTVRVWDIATAAQRRSFGGYTDLVQSVAFCPDGKRLAGGLTDGTMRLWDAATGKLLRTFTGHTGSLTSVAWSPDGTLLASGAADDTVRLWNAATGNTLQTFAARAGSVWSVTFCPDGMLLASSTEDGAVHLWDVSAGTLLRTFMGHAMPVRSVAFSPDGRRLASGSDDRFVVVWDVATGRQLGKSWWHAAPVRSVAWSPDGTRLVSGSYDEAVRLWDVATEQPLCDLVGDTYAVTAVTWRPDGACLVSGSHDTMRLWDAATGTQLRTFAGHTDWVRSIAFSPDGTRLASGSDDHTVRSWDVVTGKQLHAFAGHQGPIKCVAFCPHGARLASASADGMVLLWNAATGERLRTFEGHGRSVYSVTWCRDGRRLASGSADGTVRLWHVAPGRRARTFEGHTDWVRSVAFSPEGTLLASGSDDRTVRLWDAVTGRVRRTFEGHTHWVKSVAWRLDGTHLASGSEDGTVRLWDVATGQTALVLRGHLGAVSSVDWSRDGRFIVSSGNDGTLRIWDAITGVCLAVYVTTPNGAVVYRPSDYHYRVHGDPAGRVAYTIGLARYELGELDEFVEGGLRLRDGERLVPL